MKRIILLIIVLSLYCCSNSSKTNDLQGTWEMVYAEIKENDSLKVKDLTSSNFIKIINDSHFAFYNQDKNNSKNSYGGAGTYTLNGVNYVETLNFTFVEAIKGHQFPFTIQIKGDTLIQSGVEEVKKANIHREIIEKYIKIK